MDDPRRRIAVDSAGQTIYGNGNTTLDYGDFVSGADSLMLLGTGFDNPAAGTNVAFSNVTSPAAPNYATFAATADAFVFNETTHNLMFSDPGRGVVNFLTLTGVTSLAQSDIRIYAN